MKAKVFRELTVEELQEKHDHLWTELFGLRIKHTMGQLENPLQLRALRRDIARVKTLLGEQGVEEKSRRRRQPTVAGKAAAAGRAAGGKKKRGAAQEAGAAGRSAASGKE